MSKNTMNNDILYRRSCLSVNPYAGGARMPISRSEGNYPGAQILWREATIRWWSFTVMRGLPSRCTIQGTV